MDISRIIGWAAAGGIGGFLIGATGASVYAAATHMSKMEGGPGFFAAGIGVIAGLMGTLLAVVYSLQSWGTVVRGALAVVLLLGVAHLLYNRSQERFTKKYGSVKLEIEVRPGADAAGVSAEIHEDELSEVLTLDREGAVLAAGARLYRLTHNRSAVLRLSNGQTIEVPLAIPRNPAEARSGEWSGWNGSDWAIRYRVVL